MQVFTIVYRTTPSSFLVHFPPFCVQFFFRSALVLLHIAEEVLEVGHDVAQLDIEDGFRLNRLDHLAPGVQLVPGRPGLLVVEREVEGLQHGAFEHLGFRLLGQIDEFHLQGGDGEGFALVGGEFSFQDGADDTSFFLVVITEGTSEGASGGADEHGEIFLGFLSLLYVVVEHVDAFVFWKVVDHGVLLGVPHALRDDWKFGFLERLHNERSVEFGVTLSLLCTGEGAWKYIYINQLEIIHMFMFQEFKRNGFTH